MFATDIYVILNDAVICLTTLLIDEIDEFECFCRVRTSKIEYGTSINNAQH